MVPVIFGVGGAAIDAAKIAAVSDRDAQVGDGARELVEKGHTSLSRLRMKKPDS
jgi:hypothetical protein